MGIYTAILFLVCLFSLRHFRLFHISEKHVWGMPLAFVVKVLAGLFFLYVYSYYYGNGDLSADASVFMHDSAVLNKVFYHSPSDYFRFLFGMENDQLIHYYLSDTSHWDAGPNTLLNDSQNVLRVHSLIHFFSFGNVLIHLLVMCLLSLIGVRHLTLAFAPYSSIKPIVIFWAIVLLPSTLLWTSGIIKEPLLMLGIGLFVRGIIGKLSLSKKFIYGLTGTLILIGIKPYVLVCLIPAVLVFFIFTYLKMRMAWIALSITVLFACLMVATDKAPSFVSKLSSQQADFVNIGRGGVYARGDSCIFIISGKNKDFVRIDGNDVYLTKTVEGEYMYPYQKSAPKKLTIHPEKDPWILYYNGKTCGSYVPVTYIDQSGPQLLKNIPEALANVLLRPYPTDPPGHLMMWLAMLEQWCLLALLILAIVKHRQLSAETRHLVIAMVTFALILALAIGWTTPVLGAIVRYRFPVQLCMLIIVLIILHAPKRLRHE